MNREEFFNEVSEAINGWERERLIAIVNKELDNGFSPLEIVQEALLPRFNALFNKLQKYDITFPELLLMADTLQGAMNVLLPLIKASLPQAKTKGRIVIGTVKGDVHDIGKNIVTVVLRASGYDVTDLGRDVPHSEFIKAAVSEKADVIAASTLMTPTLVSMEELISEVKAQKLKAKTIIGGWATSPEFAERVGADAWGRDSAGGLQRVNSLMSGIIKHG